MKAAQMVMCWFADCMYMVHVLHVLFVLDGACEAGQVHTLLKKMYSNCSRFSVHYHHCLKPLAGLQHVSTTPVSHVRLCRTW